MVNLFVDKSAYLECVAAHFWWRKLDPILISNAIRTCHELFPVSNLAAYRSKVVKVCTLVRNNGTTTPTLYEVTHVARKARSRRASTGHEPTSLLLTSQVHHLIRVLAYAMLEFGPYRLNSFPKVKESESRYFFRFSRSPGDFPSVAIYPYTLVYLCRSKALDGLIKLLPGYSS